jgi:hypothetical protein
MNDASTASIFSMGRNPARVVSYQEVAQDWSLEVGKYLQMSFGSCFFGAVAWFLVSHRQSEN